MTHSEDIRNAIREGLAQRGCDGIETSDVLDAYLLYTQSPFVEEAESFAENMHVYGSRENVIEQLDDFVNNKNARNKGGFLVTGIKWSVKTLAR